ncbi:hypothetical protein [Massilia sp. TSP1-1-2]|uniref:hypothetical protein n=1 Tax=Massilia sp. TSP1-1-2 TaxID=2804649 RepID=UPI003CEA987D
MSAKSTSNKTPLLCALVALALVRPSLAHDDPSGLLKYRTTSEIHGLYKIHQEARKFLMRQPRKKAGDWVAVGPDIRMQFPRYAVSLRTRWARESDRKEGMPGVLVICKKTIDREDPNWTVLVSSYIPAEQKLEMQRQFPNLPYPPVPEQK